MAYKPAIHGRDHCPDGSDPIPCLSTTMPVWIRRSRGIASTPLGIGTSGAVNIPFLSTVGSDEYTTYFATPTSSSIQLLSDMICIVSWEWKWVENFADQTNFYIADELQNSTEFTNLHNTNEVYQFGGSFTQHWESGTDLTFDVAQSSGATKNIDWGYVMVTRLGSYTGPAPSTLDPDE